MYEAQKAQALSLSFFTIVFQSIFLLFIYPHKKDQIIFTPIILNNAF